MIRFILFWAGVGALVVFLVRRWKSNQTSPDTFHRAAGAESPASDGGAETAAELQPVP